jgi:site-specific DNA recombinase
MKRAALYARFRSDKQNERSCRDQLDLCRSWAEKRGGIIIVAEYADEAVSGASTINRLGLGRMMRDARDGAFDLVICEALDRLSRDQADLATIKKQLTFLEIGISTVQDGDVGAMHIGLKGLMGEMFLADLAQKTRRGQRARVATGASGGGRSYGYDPVPGRPGEMTINAPTVGRRARS